MNGSALLTVTLEAPTSTDALLLISKLDQFLDGLYRPDECHRLSPELLAAHNTLFCVAREDGRAVGCGAVRFLADYAEIKRMYVEPQGRGRGISRQVLRWLEEQALRNGYTTVRLETGALNREAIALYESSGYRRVPAFGEYTENGVSLCYEKVVE